MLTLDAREAKQEFGRLLDEARRAPVAINKHGRKVAVMLAAEDYERLEDLLWGRKAEEAAAEGFLGPKESAAFLGIDYHDRKPVPARAKGHSQAAAKGASAGRGKNRSSRRRGPTKR